MNPTQWSCLYTCLLLLLLLSCTIWLCSVTIKKIITVFHFAEDNKLCELLVFATGLDAIPPLGIEPSPTLVFDHPADDVDDHSREVPFVNTCANCLHIPVLADYELFKERMLLALRGRLEFHQCVRRLDSWTNYLSNVHATGSWMEWAISLSPVVVHVHSHGEMCVVMARLLMYSNASRWRTGTHFYFDGFFSWLTYVCILTFMLA